MFLVHYFFFLMIRRPPRSTRTDTLFPYTTLFRSGRAMDCCRLPSKLNSSNSLRSLLPGCSARRVLLSITPLRWHQVSNSSNSRQRLIGAKFSHSRALRLPLYRPHWFCPGSFLFGDCTSVRVSSARSGAMPGLMNSTLSARSEEHTSELQSLMRISYAVF